MFPDQLSRLHQLFKDIAELDEPLDQNRIKQHSEKLYHQLRSTGAEHDEAWDLAWARLYGPAEGEYGTSVGKLIETKQWEEEEELGAAFINSLKHVYSSQYRGKDMHDLYRANLAAVDIVSKSGAIMSMKLPISIIIMSILEVWLNQLRWLRVQRLKFISTILHANTY